MDGQNHWRAASAFVTETLPTDTWQSLTLVTFAESSIRQLVSGGALWAAWTGGMHLQHSYVLNNSGSNCITLFDNGVTKAGIPGPNWGLDLDFNCEGAAITSMVALTGSHTAQAVQNLRFSGYQLSTGSVFNLASNITSATLNEADLNVKFTTAPMFATGQAKLWNVSGRVAIPSSIYWNAPLTSNVNLALGSLITPPQIGPVDIVGSAAIAVSCARLLNRAYAGPLCRVQRSSDSATLDLYPTFNGDLDRTGFTGFCTGTTCAVSIGYDQSGNGNNFTQGTTASQPVLTLSLAALNGRPAMLFGDQFAYAMPVACGIS